MFIALKWPAMQHHRRRQRCFTCFILQQPISYTHAYTAKRTHAYTHTRIRQTHTSVTQRVRE